MKIAVVYNRESKNVINLFGLPNREKIGMRTIDRLVNALKNGRHQVITLEGDKDLVDRLEEFMPRVVKGERPGMVFNLSYGIQGQARYAHVPGILEMVGIPYIGSGPLAHSLALDKVVAKVILRQNEVPTPDFVVLNEPDSPVPADLRYPLIVKPKNEAVSFGLRIVTDEEELREAAAVIFNEFQQPVLAEGYIEGREINVGLLGNNPPEAFAPVELVFGEGGPGIYTYEDKTGRSGREIRHICPAPIAEDVQEKAQDIARRAFVALGCYDCARVDMRLDNDGNLYILEVNSLPSLGEHGSYLVGADHAGMDFGALVNRLVEVASARYFGTPSPPSIDRRKLDPPSQAFSFVTLRRDELEKRLREWTAFSTRTSDPIGVQHLVGRVERILSELGMRRIDELTSPPLVYGWETLRGYENGTLLVGHLDAPIDVEIPQQRFRRDPEWLYGEAIGSSRAPLVMLEYALRALRSMRRLRRLPLGVLLYADEGHDAQQSAETIRAAAAKARRVLVLRPGNVGDFLITRRRGQRRYHFQVGGPSMRLGRPTRKLDVLRWAWTRLESCAQLTSQKARVSVSTIDLQTERMPLRLPHSLWATLLMTYPDAAAAGEVEEKMRSLFGKGAPQWELELLSDRPPMKERRANLALAKRYSELAERWDITLGRQSSVWPSVAGLVPAKTACLCGIGPVARDLRTPHEAVQRISLVQRTLLLTEFLVEELERSSR